MAVTVVKASSADLKTEPCVNQTMLHLAPLPVSSECPIGTLLLGVGVSPLGVTTMSKSTSRNTNQHPFAAKINVLLTFHLNVEVHDQCRWVKEQHPNGNLYDDFSFPKHKPNLLLSVLRD